MKREFTFNIILLILINFLVKPAYIFGIDARIQNLVGTETYGMYFYYFNFVLLFQFINDPGIQNYNAQFIPKNRDKAGFHFINLLAVKTILAVLFIVITSLSAMLAGYTNIRLIIFLSVSVVLSTLFIILRGVVAGLGFYRTDSLLSALDKILMIVILGYLAWISDHRLNFDINSLVYGQASAYFIACAVVLMVIFRNIHIPEFNVSIAYMKRIITNSAPYVLILIFMTTYNRLDGVMLGALIDDNNYQAGVYASAYRIYDAANMIGYLFAALLLPMFAANMGNTGVLDELKNVSLRFVLLSTLMIICSIFYYGSEMLSLLYDDYEISFLNTLKVLILSYFMVAVAYIFGTMLVASGKVRNLNILFAFGLLINILLNIYLIPRYFAVGAAVSTLITQLFVMAGQIYLVQKEIGVGVRIKELKTHIVFIFVSILVFSVVNMFFNFLWQVNLALSILICLLLSFVLKIVDKDEFVLLLRKKG